MFHLKSWSLSSDLINSSNISLLIGMERQVIVLMCNISGPVAEQRSPKGRIHNPLKGESKRLCEVTFYGWETILVWSSWWPSSFPFSYFISQQRKIDLDESCESLDLCKTPASGLHEQRLPATRQLCVCGLIILCHSIMKSYSIWILAYYLWDTWSFALI